ncbi:winged helix-turn-helix transcriptional regulator [Actinomadura rupiterrae]|uniref:winged helix-turn-helix transcriptional regulator n=1 Tax=Actinomadura rupiterrae TaxID=559627 RepID=UPI0020A4F26C|nr:response regulator transcription factor [Actinomadura rupiterrae]MCP2338218.1 DNA-binding response OmpR family regulator [Actinomadura rupiterrae]
MTGSGELVLVVEHDPAVAELQRRCLTREGYRVEVEPDPSGAPDAAARLRPDAVVLDLSTAAQPVELYRRVVQALVTRPGSSGGRVVAVVGPLDPAVARGLGPHRVDRPFGPRALVQAVAVAMRRGSSDGTPELRAGALTLDTAARTCDADGADVALTATEFDLLRYLARNPGRVFTREQLLESVWGPGAGAGSRTVDVHIAQLRAKLGDASPIRTVRGVGYRLDP